MRRRSSRSSSALRLVTLCALALAASACAKKSDNIFQGWIEADYIFISPDEPGRIETMLVREGDSVKKDAVLFTLDDDLQKADVGMAEATFTNAKQAFERAQQLAKSGSGTQRDFDAAQAAFREAEARLNSQRTRLVRRRMVSPADGMVQQVYLRPGETAQTGKPVVAVLPPANMKVRFFVPEPLLARIGIDDTVTVSCDNCASDLRAKISYISRTAEFTPPVIYSREERSKLVYLVEARPEQPERLRVGQPISVQVTPREAAR